MVMTSRLFALFKYGAVAIGGFWGGAAAWGAYEYYTKPVHVNTLKYADRMGLIQVDTILASPEQKETWSRALQDAQATYTCDEHGIMTLKSQGFVSGKHEEVFLRCDNGKIFKFQWIPEKDPK